MFKKGDIVNRWHDSGAFGNKMIFGEVIRVNRKTITVRWERNCVWRIEPQHIELVTGRLAEEVKSEYLSEKAAEQPAQEDLAYCDCLVKPPPLDLGDGMGACPSCSRPRR